MAKKDAYRELLDRIVFLGCAGVVSFGAWAVNTLFSDYISTQEEHSKAINEIKTALHDIDYKLQRISLFQERFPINGKNK